MFACLEILIAFLFYSYALVIWYLSNSKLMFLGAELFIAMHIHYRLIDLLFKSSQICIIGKSIRKWSALIRGASNIRQGWIIKGLLGFVLNQVCTCLNQWAIDWPYVSNKVRCLLFFINLFNFAFSAPLSRIFKLLFGAPLASILNSWVKTYGLYIIVLNCVC